MTIGDLMDPVYITVAPKTFVLKLCIGLITGLVAHRIAHINQSHDKKYILKWSILASVAGLAFNVVADPVTGYFYKQYILGQPQEMASVLAKLSTATTFFNALVSVILVVFVYNALRPALAKAGLMKPSNRYTYNRKGFLPAPPRYHIQRTAKAVPRIGQIVIISLTDRYREQPSFPIGEIPPHYQD